MVDSKYSPENYKSFTMSIVAIIKNTEMLRFAPDHLKTKKMCKAVVKTLPFVIRFVPDQYQTQETCDKVILENGGTLMFVPDSYKNQKCVIKLSILILLQYSSFLTDIRLVKCVLTYSTKSRPEEAPERCPMDVPIWSYM